MRSQKKPVFHKPKIIVIVGPTASGKSVLAVKLAKKFGGEIISADSRQVYRELNIGTGKVAGRWRPPATTISIRSYENESKFIYKGIPHHCIDFVPPKRVFTAAEYKKCAQAAIKEITGRGKISIMAGGTAFWIDTPVYNFMLPAVPPDRPLRRRLSKKDPAALLAMLRKLDPRRAASIEPENPRRLIRAIEIAAALGRVPRIRRRKLYNALWLGLNPSYEVQPRKITERAERILRRGLVAETRRLLGQGISKKRINEFGFEYQAALDYIEGKISRAALKSRLVKETLAYAKRQMRWWKRNPDIRWIKTVKDAEGLIKKFLRKTARFAPTKTAPEAARAIPRAPPPRLLLRIFSD